jgi:hypothetical protein
MSEPLGERRKHLDNLLQETVEEHSSSTTSNDSAFIRHCPGASFSRNMDLDHDLSLEEVTRAQLRQGARTTARVQVFIADLATELQIGVQKLHEWIKEGNQIRSAWTSISPFTVELINYTIILVSVVVIRIEFCIPSAPEIVWTSSKRFFIYHQTKAVDFSKSC